MGRDLLMFDLEIKKAHFHSLKHVNIRYRQQHRIRIGISHLESMKENAITRQQQLATALETLMLDGCEVGLKLLMGDLNLRDEDVKKVYHVSKLYSDAWESIGKPKNDR